MLTIEVDTERVDHALRVVARRISRDYNIPGFRRGKVPYHVILQRFGRETLLRDALDDLGEDVVKEALESESLDPYDAASLEDVQFDPLTLKLRVPLQPIVDLGDYRELRVEPPVVAVDEEEIDAELERLRQANAILEPAGDRPTQMGDWVSLDVNAHVDDESLVREEAYTMVLDPEDQEFERGFSENIVGLKADEEKQFALTLGDNWGEEKAGKQASFSVTVREIRGRMVPGLDDDLARTIGDFDTLEELRQDIRKHIKQERQREADSAYTEEVLDALIAGSTIEHPPDLIEDQIDDMIEDLERRLESQKISFEDFLKLSGQTEEQFRESARPQAEKIARRGLALGALARQEKLDVEGSEIDERIALLSANWGESAEEARQMLSSPDSLRSIATSLLTNKVVQRLVDIAKGEAPPLEATDQESAEGMEDVPAHAETSAGEPAEGSVEESSIDEPEAVSVEAEGTPNAEEKSVSESN